MIDNLLEQGLGWLGYLERPAVFSQLLLASLVLLALKLALNQLPLGRWRLPFPGVALMALGALALLGKLAGLPHGLLTLLAEISTARLGLELLEKFLLEPRLEAQVFERFRSRILRPCFLLLVLLTLLNEVDYLNDLAALPLVTWFNSSLTLGSLFQVTVVLYLLLVGSNLPSVALGWLAQKTIGISTGSRRALELVVRYALLVAGIHWAFSYLGFNQTGLLAVAGGLSVGLGFGVKEIFANFISGLWLLLEGSVRPGEVLIIDGQPCEVRKLGLRAATLWRSGDNSELVIPNQTFFTTTTTTFTRSDRNRRCSLAVQIADRHPPRQILQLLEEIAQADVRILTTPPPPGHPQGIRTRHLYLSAVLFDRRSPEQRFDYQRPTAGGVGGVSKPRHRPAAGLNHQPTSPPARCPPPGCAATPREG
jgi:small-conductance mechanosensitive channel